MSLKINDGGQAFPIVEIQPDGYGGHHQTTFYGMSLRDWFAGMAMQGLISSTGVSEGNPDYKEECVAISAWKMADEMLKTQHPPELGSV